MKHKPSTATSGERAHPGRKFPRLSRPVELLRPKYDVVVVGSGYGAGVAASRMARGGQNVCVLERGKERWPGEYPTTIADALPDLRVSGNFQPGDKRGHYVNIGQPTDLYHLVVGQGQNAFVGSGLGGTSLLNANIFLKADAKTLAMDSWPPELRDSSALEKYYARAADMLQPEPYPETFPELPKLSLLDRQKEALGFGEFYRPPQTTRFNDGPNNVGVQMKASTLSGMDSTGLNDGSKSSTLVTYLSDAWNWGAEIFCECEVRHVLKAPGGGYNIFFAWHGGKRAEFRDNMYEDLMWVHAEQMVFLGGGSLGTTEILLRSREVGLSTSDLLGTGMSGNGDILAFGYNMNETVDSVGRELPPKDRPVGPTITGVIDCRDQEDPLDGFVIEEGAVPEALSRLYQTMLENLPGRLPSLNLSQGERFQQWVASMTSTFLGPYAAGASTERTQVYLIMSHDSNQAILTLEDDKPILRFQGVGRSDHVNKLNEHLANITHAFGGTCVNSPFYAKFGQQEITVHPIGGACISSDGTGEKGSTRHTGEVFTGSGTDYHEGLFVVDGAAIPTALGVNPFATITALAERTVELAAEARSIKIDNSTRNGTLDLSGSPARSHQNLDSKLWTLEQNLQRNSRDSEGIEFTEVMTGYLHLGAEIEDFEVAARNARGASQSARFFLSMHASNMYELLDSPDHEGTLTGTFTHGGLKASPYMVLRGKFQLFNDDGHTSETKNLTYDFDMVGTDGTWLHFHGYKVVSSKIAGNPLATWRATSTLYSEITSPDTRAVIARGTLHITPQDFASELKTFAPSGASAITRLFSASQFLRFFTSQVALPFFGPFSTLRYPDTTTVSTASLQRPSPTQIFEVTSTDNVTSPLHFWSAKSSHPKSTPLLFIPGASVDHQIFALPTLKQNAIEYFRSLGYACYCVTHRVGKHAEAKKGWTTYDARLDIVAAFDYVQRETGRKVYIISHCAGALATSAAILDGTLPTTHIAGLTASNCFFTPVLVGANKAKAALPVPLTSVYKAVAGNWVDGNTSPNDTLIQRTLNQALRFYPVGSREEICHSAVCHRLSLIFGRLWSHKNLNEATHAHLERFLTGMSMPGLSHLVACGSRQQVLKSDGKTSLLKRENLQRYKGLKILLFSGGDNVVFGPETTERAYDKLRDELGTGGFQRVVFEGRGHLDCWMSDKSKDVWKRVGRHVEEVAEAKTDTVSVNGVAGSTALDGGDIRRRGPPAGDD